MQEPAAPQTPSNTYNAAAPGAAAAINAGTPSATGTPGAAADVLRVFVIRGSVDDAVRGKARGVTLTAQRVMSAVQRGCS